jgi:hypothetical protein
MSLESTGMGGSISEEIEGFRKVVEVVQDEVKQLQSESSS